MFNRRLFLGGIAALPTVFRPMSGFAQSAPRRLTMPPLLDATATGRFRLEARRGTTDFTGAGAGETWGFNQSYLGPTLRLATGQTTEAEIVNALSEAITVHWHGLVVPGEADGGPHQSIAPNETWAPALQLTQPVTTAWYHSHIHGETARHVQKGLAGVLHVVDGQDSDRGLPGDYGIDDLTLVLQDRRFDRRGRIDYSLAMPDRMMGFLGDTMVVNGQVGAEAVVPRGMVRLRLVNGSNARIYPLSFADGREMHLIATDGGLLDRPIALNRLTIAPGERYEVLVDFSNGQGSTLVSGTNPNMMMGRMRGGGGAFTVLPFHVDTSLRARIAQLPDDLGGSRPSGPTAAEVTRRFSLDMPMGMMMRRGGDMFAINGQAFDMDRMNLAVQLGATERWQVSAARMMHPFHIHGVTFQVLAENGVPPKAWNTGWKDTVLVDGTVDILVRFTQPASPATPFMYHCHILEHEDGGMMGQFTVK
ncbi:MAG: multicopper oxidase domain-containing protein [Roseovarius sp.]|nr:multicopper oxidase domain-containing protein [Roseovarius sp.]